jgi:pyruvate dehydrogenase complex dehydrogenase (E1) component
MSDSNPQETEEWLDSVDALIEAGGPDRASWLSRATGDDAVSERRR